MSPKFIKAYDDPYLSLWSAFFKRAFRDATGYMADVTSAAGKEVKIPEKKNKSKIRTQQQRNRVQESTLLWFADQHSEHIGSSNWICRVLEIDKKAVFKAITEEIRWFS